MFYMQMKTTLKSPLHSSPSADNWKSQTERGTFFRRKATVTKHLKSVLKFFEVAGNYENSLRDLLSI